MMRIEKKNLCLTIMTSVKKYNDSCFISKDLAVIIVSYVSFDSIFTCSRNLKMKIFNLY